MRKEGAGSVGRGGEADGLLTSRDGVGTLGETEKGGSGLSGTAHSCLSGFNEAGEGAKASEGKEGEEGEEEEGEEGEEASTGSSWFRVCSWGLLVPSFWLGTAQRWRRLLRIEGRKQGGMGDMALSMPVRTKRKCSQTLNPSAPPTFPSFLLRSPATFPSFSYFHPVHIPFHCPAFSGRTVRGGYTGK